MSTLLNGSFPPLFDKASGSPIPKDKITANDVMPAILYILFALTDFLKLYFSLFIYCEPFILSLMFSYDGSNGTLLFKLSVK